MFTGIVEELGSVDWLHHGDDSAELHLKGPLVSSDAAPGASISCNGVCLTVVDLSGGSFSADVMAETLHRSALGGLKDLLTGYWRPILTMAGLVIAVNVVNYTLLSYMPTYLEGTGGMEYQTVLTISFVTQFGMMLLIPFAGSLSDRLGRKPVWRISLIGLIVMSVPMYMLMSQGVWGTLIGISVLGLLYVLQLATISATFPAMFPTKVRFAGFAITYNVSTSLFGGTAPSVNEALIEATGSPLVPAFYMVAACIVGLIAVHFMKETVGASLRGNDIPETGPQEIVRIRAGKA